MTVAIIVDKRATRIPTLAAAAHSGLFRHVRECPVSIVVIQDIFSKVRYEQVFVSIIVIVSDAHALAPAGMQQAGLRGDVGECAIAIVLEQMGRGSLAGGKTFQTRTVDQENIEPAVVVVIVERNAAAGRSSKYLFLCSPPKIVLTFSPDSRATLTNVTPSPLAPGVAISRALAGLGDRHREERAHLPQTGRANERISCSESTSADRLSDLRNVRREENKRDTFPHWPC